MITSLSEGALLHPGNLQLRGLAWSGSGMIHSVQVSFDGGKFWRSASIDSGASRYDWCSWAR